MQGDLQRARDLALGKIARGELPAERVDADRLGPDDRHFAPCAVCDQVIREEFWYRLKCRWNVPDPHQVGERKPEMHVLCHGAWCSIVNEIERRRSC